MLVPQAPESFSTQSLFVKEEFKRRDRLNQFRHGCQLIPLAFSNQYSVKPTGTTVYEYLLIIKVEPIFPTPFS